MASLVACGSSSPPDLTGLEDQVAQVGQELRIELHGTDASGARLAYSYRAPDVTDLEGHAELTVAPSGVGVFRWTPLATDIGAHPFDFTVSDGGSKTTVTITITVKPAIGAATAPIFRQPLGGGTTIDVARETCVDVDIAIQDQDTSNVTLKQEEPLIDGAMLTQADGRVAKWHWCPTRDQETENRFTLTLSADDGENPKTIKNYLIVLRDNGGVTCPGSGPTIASTPHGATTRLDLPVTAMITDALGLKDTPLVYYSTTNPGAKPDLSTMTQLSAVLASGDHKNGTWNVAVPNPVASASAGMATTLYYVIAADDRDEAHHCDHVAQSPVYQLTVTAGGTQTAGLCQACTADSQCGPGNECVYMGSMGLSYCLQSCDAGCASGYTCSSSTIFSVDGARTSQCVPVSGSCEAPTGSCADDSWEVDDSRSQASANPVLAPDLYDMVSCPSPTSTTRANDDWYKVVLSADQRVDLQLSGDGATDLDLHVYHSDGTVVSASTSSTPDEEINACLPKATYYVKVNGYGHARSQYYLAYDQHAESCSAACSDDSHEDDDTFSQARATTYPTFASTGNTICPNDDDWYHVPLYSGETMTVDLTFTQNTASQDLDLHLYTGSLDQWPCSPSDPSTCSVAHGQSADSNEHATFTAPASCASGCDYYVVVRGWAGSTNSYDIAIGVQ